MRKLATVQRITKLTPIEGADKIVKATVLGWEVVVLKNEFKEGDLCVYCEVDSILPDKPEFSFLRERKFRIKTIKLKGQVSQGICFPMSILRNIDGYREGSDVTEKLGVKKYDPEAELEKKEADRLAEISKNRLDKFMKRYAWYRRFLFKPTRKPFPAFIKKTDEDRVQLFPNICNDYEHDQFSVTEKIDGQSGTYFCIRNPKRGLFQPKYLFGVSSRNFQLLKPDTSTYWTIAKRYDLEKKMKAYCEASNQNLIIQGEIAGRGIQGNKYGIDGIDLFVFNIFIEDKKNGRTQLDYQGITYMCYNLKLQKVPFLGYTYLPKTIPELVEQSKDKSKLNPSIPREGIVVRNYDKGVSFKVINPDFLLKYDF